MWTVQEILNCNWEHNFEFKYDLFFISLSCKQCQQSNMLTYWIDDMLAPYQKNRITKSCLVVAKNIFDIIIMQGRASGMDWTLTLIFWKSETSRDIKK